MIEEVKDNLEFLAKKELAKYPCLCNADFLYAGNSVLKGLKPSKGWSLIQRL